MRRDATFLRVFQACLVLGGAFTMFAVLDAGLAATGIYPWVDVGLSIARLGLGIVVAVLAFAVARLAWRERDERDLGGVTFADAVIVVGFALVGGFLLLGLLR